MQNTIKTNVNQISQALAQIDARKPNTIATLEYIACQKKYMQAAFKNALAIRKVTSRQFNSNRNQYKSYMAKNCPDYVVNSYGNNSDLYVPIEGASELSIHDKTGLTYMAVYSLPYKMDSNGQALRDSQGDKIPNGLRLESHYEIYINETWVKIDSIIAEFFLTASKRRAAKKASKAKKAIKESTNADKMPEFVRYAIHQVTRLAMVNHVFEASESYSAPSVSITTQGLNDLLGLACESEVKRLAKQVNKVTESYDIAKHEEEMGIMVKIKTSLES